MADGVERVVVINDSTVARGGATALALLGARLIRARGPAVTYFAGDGGDGDGSLQTAGIDLIALGEQALSQRSVASALTAGIFNVTAYQRLRDWVGRCDTPHTVYHVHGWHQILSPSIFMALKPVAARTLLHAHDYFLVCPNGSLMNYMTDRVCTLTPMSRQCLGTDCDKRHYSHKLWRVGRQMMRSALFDISRAPVEVALIQQGMAEAFTRSGIPASRLRVIPNPSVPFSQTRVGAEHNQLFYFIGRLVPEKGIDELLAAARLAKVAVRVIGDGPLREALAQRYPEFLFEAWRSREELCDLVQDARMLVMPSLYPEPFGLVVAEAVASGLPVILADSALLAGEVVAQQLGRTIDPRDVTEFAALLSECAADDAAVLAMSERGFAGDQSISLRPTQWAAALHETYSALLVRATAAPP